jgi:membrane-associated phospholipid phosphatase
MSAYRLLLALILATLAAGAILAVWPGLDLAVTAYVFAQGGFWERSEAARDARDILRLAPIWLLCALIALALARLRWRRLPGPSVAGAVFLAASLIVGAGLIVNLGLKDHSHRPRPVHVTEFGGDQAFRPWYRFDGACRKNCSFASGEAASGFWMVAPALLAPPPWQAPAVVGALLFGVATSALRIAFGGHFLSDVIGGAAISLIVTLAMWRVYRRRSEAASAAGSRTGKSQT